MGQGNLRIKVFGSRGSYSSTSCEATSVGVNTTSLRIDIGDHRLIIDAGSGIINLGRELLGEMFATKGDADKWPFHIFFTHMHIDHLAGFPYFAPLYLPKSEINFFSPTILDYRLEDVLDRFVHPPLFPVSFDDLPFDRVYNTIKESSVIFFTADGYTLAKTGAAAPEDWQLKISCMRNYMHPKGGSFFYRFDTPNGKSMVFASDTEGYVGGDQRLIQFARGANVLFHDAQYTLEEYAKSQGFGHSTYEMACHVAQVAGVDRLLLFHHDPQHSDEVLQEIETSAQALFANTQITTEFMDFEL